MKAMKTILAMMAVVGLAMAQTPSASKPKAPASQAVSGTATAAPAKMPAKKPVAAAAAKPAAKAAKTPAKPAPMTPKKAVVSAVAKPSPVRTEAPAKKPGNKRDPFVNPVVRVAAGGTGSMCSTGKRCLMINDMMLRGIVKTANGMIAVVSNSANRAYFLKENDPVFNGTVVRITGDSVVFRENVVDNLGRESTREVVKRVSAPTV